MILFGVLFDIGSLMVDLSLEISIRQLAFLWNPTQYPALLKRIHGHFTESRQSDHAIFLSAFHRYEQMVSNIANGVEGIDSNALKNLCRLLQFNEPTMQKMYDAKRHLLFLLGKAIPGFDIAHFQPYEIQGKSEDPNLDMMAGLMCVGLYPNICLRLRNAHLLLRNKRYSRIDGSSVMCTMFSAEVDRLFVFDQNIRCPTGVCRQFSKISPIHALLFGSGEIVAIGPNEVLVDGWIRIKMNSDLIKMIMRLRSHIERLAIKLSESLDKSKFTNQEKMLISIVKELMHFPPPPSSGITLN